MLLMWYIIEMLIKINMEVCLLVYYKEFSSGFGKNRFSEKREGKEKKGCSGLMI